MDGQTDGQMDGQTDGQKKSLIEAGCAQPKKGLFEKIFQQLDFKDISTLFYYEPFPVNSH